MTTLTVTSKGQVTFRKEVLEHLGVSPGDGITVHKLSNGRVEISAARPSAPISDLFGLLQRPDGPTLSIEQMNDIIADGWSGKP